MQIPADYRFSVAVRLDLLEAWVSMASGDEPGASTLSNRMRQARPIAWERLSSPADLQRVRVGSREASGRVWAG